MDFEKSTNEETSPVFTLPTEMLEEIFKRLPFRELLKCREVHSTWKRAATNSVRKRCATLNFSREDIRSANQRSRAVQSFIELIRATIDQGRLEDFPVTKFYLDLYSDYYWIEIGGSSLICHLLEAVSPFARRLILMLNGKCCKVPDTLAMALKKNLAFPNLTEVKLKVFENEVGEIFRFIGNVIGKSPDIKDFHLYLIHVAQIRRCIVETGIMVKPGMVTSLIVPSDVNEDNLEYLNQVGFKLKHFNVNLLHLEGKSETLKNFLESQSDTLTSLTIFCGNIGHFRELPCLHRLQSLSLICDKKAKKELQLPILFYKEKLPELKTMDLQQTQAAIHYLMATHLAPSESLREIILPDNDRDVEGFQVVRQAARIYPNLKKLNVFHTSAKYYMRDVYETLTGIEELCILTEGDLNVDDIITGLPEKLMRKIWNKSEDVPPPYYWSKAFAIQESGTTKSLACLENLKVLAIDRRGDHDGNVPAGIDFSELSGAVLKQMKTLQCINFGVRKYGPVVSVTLKEDLEAQGIKLLYRKPPYTRPQTDFIESLAESTDSGSDEASDG